MNQEKHSKECFSMHKRKKKKNLGKKNKIINTAMILRLLLSAMDHLMFTSRALVSTSNPYCPRAFTLVSLSR